MQKTVVATFHVHNNATLNAVALMSFLWSLSSLMIFSVLPAFLVDELNMEHAQIGLVEGLATSSSFLSKFFSGYLSDMFRSRKALIMIGAVMSTIIKPLFALCYSPMLLFGLRFTDRLSKGIRSAPTDALIADLSDTSLYATNFGLRQALYTLGAVVGALVAMIIMVVSENNYRLVFALSCIPALMSLLVLWILVRPHPQTHPRSQSQFQFKQIRLKDVTSFPPIFWILLVAFFFLMLARFSEAFLTLKAKDVGWSIALLPAMIIIMDLVHAALAWPAGKFADRFSRQHILLFGLLVNIFAQMTLSFVDTIPGVILGVVFVGIHMGITQGLLKAIIAESTPPELRGTAFSIFFIVSGIAIFLGNAVAGNLSQHFGLYATFLAGGIFTTIAAAILYFAYDTQKTSRALNDGV